MPLNVLYLVFYLTQLVLALHPKPITVSKISVTDILRNLKKIPCLEHVGSKIVVLWPTIWKSQLRKWENILRPRGDRKPSVYILFTAFQFNFFPASWASLPGLCLEWVSLWLAHPCHIRNYISQHVLNGMEWAPPVWAIHFLKQNKCLGN
jgi:hypothetical protein